MPRPEPATTRAGPISPRRRVADRRPFRCKNMVPIELVILIAQATGFKFRRFGDGGCGCVVKRP